VKDEDESRIGPARPRIAGAGGRAVLATHNCIDQSRNKVCAGLDAATCGLVRSRIVVLRMFVEPGRSGMVQLRQLGQRDIDRIREESPHITYILSVLAEISSLMYAIF